MRKHERRAVEVNEHTLKSLGQMSLDKQLLFVESYLPDAWEYLHDIASGAELPIFDDNDDMIFGSEEEKQ